MVTFKTEKICVYFYVIIDELASISELSHTLSNNETKMDENERTRRLEQ